MSSESSPMDRAVPHGRTVSLSHMLEDLNTDDNTGNEEDARSHPGLHIQPLDDLPDAGGRAFHSSGGYSPTKTEAHGQDIYHQGGYDANKASGFREYTTGQPVYQYLRTSKPRSPQLSRRATLADRPEIDHQLVGHRLPIEGEVYLPLTVTTIRILAPYVQGAKPLADVGLLHNLLIDKEVMSYHGEPLLACLKGIGEQCLALVLSGEDSNVAFAQSVREWNLVLVLVPNVKNLQIKATI
ncbi:hypothetical protein K491DRAFT_780624 [Lophiostoma macrostomum CBS 122681]|uniref:Uncharacterized protein n=1 Tax=Lophiostoma macrostomum CBS 122681 TaxID=1314788 RepID=A0A6A6SZ21_9PLEO|nr:hypothetical protein K491DRAFT_780624 [Lophiostoma macrostomum CBS 122681]